MSTLPAMQDGGWQAALHLGFEQRGGRTVLARRKQRGPLAVQRPFHPGDGACHLYLLHPPGGIVGGDGLDIRVHAAAGSAVLVTTPGATKFYRSAGPCAHVSQRLGVAGNGALEWMPQENILFPGAEAIIETDVELDADSGFIGWETVCLGRPAAGERFAYGWAEFGLRVTREGRPLLVERLRIDGGGLDEKCGLRGHAAVSTLIAAWADADHLSAAREALGDDSDGEIAGVTLIDGLLVARYLGPGAEAARRRLIPVWEALRPCLLGRAACPPRIWAT